MSRITPHLRGRYRGKLSRRTPAVDPLVLRPALALTFWAVTALLPRLLPDAAVTTLLLPVSRLVSAPIKLVSSLVPFAILELLLLALPLAAVALIAYSIWQEKNTPKGREGLDDDEHFGLWEALSLLVTVAGIMLGIFQLTLGFGYHGLTLEQRLHYPEVAVTAESLSDTATLLAERAAGLRREADYEDRTVTRYGRELRRCYKSLAERHAVFKGYAARPKKVVLSVGMSYLGIGGMYSPFTCEAMINTDTVPFALPFTIAHEMAHSLLVAREDEANFAGFLACLESDDAALAYSGHFMALLYTCSAFNRADPEQYRLFYETMDEGVRDDLIAYSRHVDQYDGWINEMHSKVNDTFLKSNGQQAGVASYGLMVNLLVAWAAQQ
ncbi:MAG: DUF3810 domain-containing protein [Clostridia bacterium]|nr:DUF3810 domain-containing protein [Clostridia bacterium]